MGADVALSQADFSIGIKQSWEQALESAARGGKPYAIPAGASDHPLGGLGYVGFAEELRGRSASSAFRFDFILTASGSGSTQAGMVVGFAADGRADRSSASTSRQAAGDARAVKRIAGAHGRAGRARPRHHRRRNMT